MEENENKTKFKAIPTTGESTYTKSQKKHTGFGRNILLPFISGVVGCTVVIGTCFGIPSIRTKLFGNPSISTTNNTSTNSDGYS